MRVANNSVLRRRPAARRRRDALPGHARLAAHGHRLGRHAARRPQARLGPAARPGRQLVGAVQRPDAARQRPARSSRLPRPRLVAGTTIAADEPAHPRAGRVHGHGPGHRGHPHRAPAQARRRRLDRARPGRSDGHRGGASPARRRRRGLALPGPRRRRCGLHVRLVDVRLPSRWTRRRRAPARGPGPGPGPRSPMPDAFGGAVRVGIGRGATRLADRRWTPGRAGGAAADRMRASPGSCWTASRWRPSTSTPRRRRPRTIVWAGTLSGRRPHADRHGDRAEGDRVLRDACRDRRGGRRSADDGWPRARGAGPRPAQCWMSTVTSTNGVSCVDGSSHIGTWTAKQPSPATPSTA